MIEYLKKRLRDREENIDTALQELETRIEHLNDVCNIVEGKNNIGISFRDWTIRRIKRFSSYSVYGCSSNAAIDAMGEMFDAKLADADERAKGILKEIESYTKSVRALEKRISKVDEYVSETTAEIKKQILTDPDFIKDLVEELNKFQVNKS